MPDEANVVKIRKKIHDSPRGMVSGYARAVARAAAKNPPPAAITNIEDELPRSLKSQIAEVDPIHTASDAMRRAYPPSFRPVTGLRGG